TRPVHPLAVGTARPAQPATGGGGTGTRRSLAARRGRFRGDVPRRTGATAVLGGVLPGRRRAAACQHSTVTRANAYGAYELDSIVCRRHNLSSLGGAARAGSRTPRLARPRRAGADRAAAFFVHAADQ